MALSLAACGGSSTTTTTTDSSTTTTTTATGQSLAFTTAADALVGTSGDDTFTGLQSGTAADDTLDSYDSVAGGEGTDTLHVINEQNAAYSPIDASGIEVFKYQGTDNSADLDADDAHGATSIILYRTENGVDVSDLVQAQSLTIRDSLASADSTITYKATDVANAADSDTVVFDGISAGADVTFSGAVESMTISATGDASSLADLGFDATGTTSVTLALGSDLTVTGNFDANAATTVTVTGAGDFTASATTDNDLAAMTTFDASAATGNMSLLINDAKDQTITTGSGDDVIDMDATLTYADTIDLGAGDDTLRVDLDSLSAGTADLNISNVETLRLDNTAGNNGAIQMDNTSFTTVRFDTGASRSGTLTLTDLPAANILFNYKGAGTLDGDPQFNGVVYDYDVTTAIAAATINVDNGGKVADDIFVGKIDMDMVTAITINGTEIGQAAADELTIDEVEGDNFTDLIVTADGEVIVTDIDGDLVDTIDFSGVSSGVAVGGAGTGLSDSAAAVAVTMGSGNDTFEVSDTAAAVTIDLGAGNDLFISDTGIDTVTTGAGVDTVRFTGAADDDSNVITDFTVGAGGDIIDFASSGVNGADDVAYTAYQEFATFAAWATDTAANTDDEFDGGLVVIGANVTAGTEAALVTAAGANLVIADTGNNGAGTADDVLYIVADNGTDTFIFHFDAADTDGTIDADDVVVLIATLEGVSDATALNASNFSDFI